MSKPEIEVVEKAEAKPLPGNLVVIAQIGPHNTLFQIREVRGKRKPPRLVYFVDEVEVDGAVYQNALLTAAMNEYCPDCDVDDESEVEPS
jgi:hypothetical protein